MKGLRKYLSPFAPDQSGAAAVLCEFHGLIIILDAGGCAGNICGFDEPMRFLEGMIVWWRRSARLVRSFPQILLQ